MNYVEIKYSKSVQSSLCPKIEVPELIQKYWNEYPAQKNIIIVPRIDNYIIIYNSIINFFVDPTMQTKHSNVC